MLTPLLRMDFQALANSQYVVPQYLKPCQANFGESAAWDFDTSRRIYDALAELKTSHAGWQLVGSAGTRENLLGGIFDVAAVAMAPDRSFALFSGKPTQKVAGLSDLADLARGEMLSDVDLGELEAIWAWEQALWRWDGPTGGIVPLEKFGRVATIDIAASGMWATVIEDIPGPYDAYVSRVALPSGRREWSVPIQPWVAPHVRISPYERWIALGGPAIVDAATGAIRAPRDSPVANTNLDGRFGLPHWHPRRSDRLLCIGRRMDLSAALHRYEIDLATGELVEEAPIPGPMADGDTGAPRVLGCDIDRTGTFAMVVSDLGVQDAAIEDTGGGALSCLNLDRCTVEWTQPMIDGAFVRVLGSPRWTMEAPQAANVDPALSMWTSVDAHPITDHNSSRMRDQRSSGFDQEFPHRGSVAVNRMLRADNDGEVQLATYFALLDLDAARELGQLAELGDQLVSVLSPIVDGTDSDWSTAQRLAARQLLTVTSEPQGEAFWRDVLYE